MKPTLRQLVSGLIAALTLIVILQNMEVVETRLLFFTVSMPRALLLALTALAGFAAGLLVALRREPRREA
jgi:uncharacterized integral membrane protein